MNREISNYYRTLVGKELSEKLALEALYAAIRNEDISIIKAYRGKAPTNEDEWEEKKCEDMYPMRFALREMAHVSVLEALLDIGWRKGSAGRKQYHIYFSAAATILMYCIRTLISRYRSVLILMMSMSLALYHISSHGL